MAALYSNLAKGTNRHIGGDQPGGYAGCSGWVITDRGCCAAGVAGYVYKLWNETHIRTDHYPFRVGWQPGGFAARSDFAGDLLVPCLPQGDGTYPAAYLRDGDYVAQGMEVDEQRRGQPDLHIQLCFGRLPTDSSGLREDSWLASSKNFSNPLQKCNKSLFHPVRTYNYVGVRLNQGKCI